MHVNLLNGGKEKESHRHTDTRTSSYGQLCPLFFLEHYISASVTDTVEDCAEHATERSAEEAAEHVTEHVSEHPAEYFAELHICRRTCRSAARPPDCQKKIIMLIICTAPELEKTRECVTQKCL